MCRILKSENNFESVILQFAVITRTNNQTLLCHVTDENITLGIIDMIVYHLGD